MSRFIYIAIIFSCTCFFEHCLAQTDDTQKTIERAMKHIKDAEKYYIDTEYKKAKESYQFAARLFRNNNLPAYYAICYNGIGNIYIDLSLYEDAKNKGFDKSIQQLSEIKSIDPNFDIDSSLIADAYEGLGRYYSSISTTLKTEQGKEETKVHYDVALEYHQKALAIRLKLYGNLHAKVAQSYYFIGQCYRGFSSNSNHSESKLNPIQMELDYLLRALKMQQQTIGEEHHQSANSYEALGNFHYEIKKDYHKGFDYHQKALKIRQNRFDPNHPQIASSFNNLAIYYRIMNVFDEELSHLEKALKIQLSILGTEHEDVGKSYYLLAKRYRRAGEINKAISYYGFALDIFRKVKHEASAEVAESYLALALCYRDLDQTKLEHQYLRFSERIFEKLLAKNHFKIALVHTELGTYYAHQEVYDSALYYYNNAIAINKMQLGEKHHAVADVYDKIATVYRFMGNKDYELDFLLQSLALKQDESYQKNRPEEKLSSGFDEVEDNQTLAQQLYKSYIQLAQFHERNGAYPLALEHIQRALAAVCPSLDKENIDLYTNPSTDELSRNIEWLNALEAKALLFMKWYELKEKDSDLEFAIKTYYQAIEVIHSLRTNFTSTSSRQQLTQHSMPVYEGAIAALYVIYSKKKDVRYLNEAFKITEQSKTFALLQALQNTHARGSSNIPAFLLDREKELRRSLAYYSNYKNRDVKNDQKFDKVYYQLKASYDSLITQLELAYPTYYKLKYQTEVQSANSVEKYILDENTLLLEYFVGDKHLYVFQLTQKNKVFFQIPIPKDYQSLVNNLRSALTNYDMINKHPKWAYQSFTIASHRFYEQLLAPFIQNIPTEINQLTIVPDGLLNHIPFEVLISEKPLSSTANTPYQDLPFLLKRFQINYSYSSTLLISNILHKNPSNNGQCLAFAPSISQASDSLPWTAKELEAIEGIYEGDYFLGEAANKKAFKSLAQDFSIVHLAMHGYVNMRTPMRSYLSFADNIDSLNADASALFAYEIHNLSLNADLVVLSACHTGFGKAIRGEGVLSLAHAFLYAGAPSVVTTLWDVNDFTSAALIETFYSNLAQGMTKSLALQQAKLTFLSKTDQYSGHPTYWASFITIGNPTPISNVHNHWLWWLLLPFSILLMLGSFWFYKRKKEKRSAAVLEPLPNLTQEQLIAKEDALQEKLMLDDDNPVLFYEIGLFQLEQLKKYTKASFSFEEAIDLDPNFAAAYLGLAKCNKELGQLDLAQKNYQQAYRLDAKIKTPANDLYLG